MNKAIATTAAISAVAGGVLGGVVTYLTVNKTLRTRYEDWANSEIDNVKARYALLRKDAEGLDILAQAQNPSPQVLEAVSQGKKIIEQMGYSVPDVVEDLDTAGEGEPEPETTNIFDKKVKLSDISEDEESEEESHDDDYEIIEGEPYKISEEEYFENEPGYELDTLTYYEIDDTLCDEHNTQIDRVDETIGARHLHMFHKDKSQTKNSIYIRNDSHEALYEVILIESSYAAIVLGMDEETLGLKAPKERPRRMRDED